MTKTQLKIAKDYYLESRDAKILAGSVNVYLTCFHKNIKLANVFLCKCKLGDVVPCFNLTQDDINYKIFINTSYQTPADEKCFVNYIEPSTKSQTAFLKKIDTYKVQGSFEEVLSEFYNLRHLEDSRNIYASKKLNASTTDQTIKDVVKSHNYKKYTSYQDYEESNDLFFAINTLFDYFQLDKPDETLINSKDTLDKQIIDYSGLSKVLCRSVKLKKNWEKQDIGPLLCFDKETNEPVACVPTKSNKYYLYSKNIYKKEKLNNNTAKKLTRKAYIFYRPLPNTSLNFNDVFLFSLKSLSLKDVFGVVLFGLGCSLLGLSIPWFANLVYGKFIYENEYSAILSLGFIVVLTLVCAASFGLIRNLVTFGVSTKMKYSLQAGIFGRLFNLKQGFINKHSSADLSLRATGASQAFGILNTELVNAGLAAVFSILFLFQMFTFYSWVSVVGLIMVILVGVVLLLIFRVQVKYRNDLVEHESHKSSLLFSFIKGVAKLRVANAESRALKKYVDVHIKSTLCDYEISRLGTLSTSIYSCFTLLSNIVLFAMSMFGGITSITTESMGNFIAYMSCFAIFSASMLQLPLSLSNFSMAIPYLKRMELILKESHENEKAQKIGTLERGDIVIDNMSFTYSPEFENILSDICLHIHPGEYLGIVGRSGCGKTTLMNLLLGFETPTIGKIYYDSQDWEYLDKCQMRQKFGVVLQDGDIIPGSIFENITISKPDANIEEATHALELVGLADEVKLLPMGIHTFISSDSETISGGQKQRILIARAIVNKPKIIFMDEATSALDNTTQAHVIESLGKLKATKVVIAHRLSTVMDCDRIIVIDSGGIAEEGDYDSLIKKRGIFWSLVNRQVE